MFVIISITYFLHHMRTPRIVSVHAVVATNTTSNALFLHDESEYAKNTRMKNAWLYRESEEHENHLI